MDQDLPPPLPPQSTPADSSGPRGWNEGSGSSSRPWSAAAPGGSGPQGGEPNWRAAAAGGGAGNGGGSAGFAGFQGQPGWRGGAQFTQEWERTYAVFIHLAHLLTLVMPVVLPLVIAISLWLVKRDQSRFVDAAGKESVNFQISLIIYHLAGAIIVLLTCGLGLVIAIPLSIALLVVQIVVAILAALAASKGTVYRYPLCLRFI